MTRRSISFASVVVFAIAGLAAEKPATAASAPRIHLDVVGCNEVATAELRRLVVVEIGDQLDEASQPEGAETPRRVAIVCEDPDAPRAGQTAHLSARDIGSGRSITREIAVLQIPKSERPRLLAIAVAELVTALWSDPRDAEAARVPVARPATSGSPLVETDVVAAAPGNAGSGGPWRFGVDAIARRAGKIDPVLFGGGGFVERRFGGPFAGAFDVQAESASQKASLGTVHVLLLSASLAASVGADFGRFRWQSGLGARVGFARLAGTPSETSPPDTHVRGEVVFDPWGGPMFTMSLAADTGSHTFASLGFEIGYATAGVAGVVNGATAVTVSEFWSAAALRVGYSP